ncbi:MAG: DNA replication and repair protein RecF [Lentisphaeria bacterium]|nr:DNA replication and repair protein RecF [Lentisphaeria bacterium]
MPVIEHLELHHFRNYSRGVFDFDAPATVLTGHNGAGKSNLLEAVFFLSILRSFRTAGLREMIQLGERGFLLNATVRKVHYPVTLEIEQSAGARQLRIDQVPIRRSSEFIREFRAVAFAPEDKLIVSGASSCRRKFFDMFISVMEPGYLTALQRYAASLSRRNAALRNPSAGALAIAAAFEPELAETAAVIRPARRRWSAKICNRVNELLGQNRLQCLYDPEDPDDPAAYQEKLCNQRQRDRKRGFTTFGPQVDEFQFLLDGKVLRSFGSNGQLRLMSLYLKMAEFSLVREEGSSPVIALVDDVTGELDQPSRENFFHLLKQADQCLFTFTELPQDPFFQQAQHLMLNRN